MKKGTVKKFVKRKSNEIMLAGLLAGSTTVGFIIGVRYGVKEAARVLNRNFPELELQNRIAEKIQEAKS